METKKEPEIIIEKTTKKAEEPKNEVKNARFNTIFNILKQTKGAIILSILSIILSVFVLTFCFSIMAQSGVTLIATIILALYVIIIGIVALLSSFITIWLTKDNLKKTQQLIAFILGIVSILMLIGSILVIYLL